MSSVQISCALSKQNVPYGGGTKAIPKGLFIQGKIVILGLEAALKLELSDTVSICIAIALTLSLPRVPKVDKNRNPGGPILSNLYYTILYYTILYYTILYYTILYYTILYYTILYYTILCESQANLTFSLQSSNYTFPTF